jgi:16S rRNA (adenine1518-N6/adenine1519-N6)-dimethyltransferase
VNDPASPSNASALLRAYGLRPRKRWGQNFLCDRNVLDRIVRAAALQPGDNTLEIGAGLGALTRSLADFCESVTSVEIDRLLEPILRETLAGRDNVRLVFADFLQLDLPALLDQAFGPRSGIVVANIPYYITTPILERLLAHKARIRRIVLLVQQEFAERLAAKPGTEQYGSMTVFAQYHARVEMAGKVSRSVFLPPPEVGSAIVALTPVMPGTVAVRDETAFFRLVRAAFGQRRKTLLNALAGGDTGLDRPAAGALLARAGIDPSRRGETLSLQEFARLADRA